LLPSSSTRISRSSRTKATQAPSGSPPALVVAAPRLRQGTAGHAAVGRGLDQVQARGLADALSRGDHQAPPVGEPVGLRVLPVDAEREDARLPARERHDADAAVHGERTREPSGDTRGSPAGSLPKVSRRSTSSERRRQ
jgi:hypothetical protein